MMPAEEPRKEERQSEAACEQRLARHRGLAARHAQARAARPNAAAAAAASTTVPIVAAAADAAVAAAAAGAAGRQHRGVREQQGRAWLGLGLGLGSGSGLGLGSGLGSGLEQQGGALCERACLAHCEAALGAGERRTLQWTKEQQRQQHHGCTLAADGQAG
mgnify:CR=1 FL=1